MYDVAVIIPCHNHGHLLGEAVASVLAQGAVAHGMPVQIIIVDDGSTDDSAAVAHAWGVREPQRIEVIVQNQSGQAAARQAALERVRCEYLVMLDADDLLEPNMFAEAVPALDREEQAPAIIGQALLVAADGQTVIRKFKQNVFRYWPSILEYNPYGVLAACMVRTAAVREAGGLAVPGLPGCEDWDLWIRLVRSKLGEDPLQGTPSGTEFTMHPGTWARYRQSAGNFSRRALPMLDAEIELIARACRPDPRLKSSELADRVIGPKDLALLTNGRVYHALGKVLAEEYEEQHGFVPDRIKGILGKLVAGGLDSRFCCTLAAWGISFTQTGYAAERNDLARLKEIQRTDVNVIPNELFGSFEQLLRQRLSDLEYAQDVIDDCIKESRETFCRATFFQRVFEEFRNRRRKKSEE